MIEKWKHFVDFLQPWTIGNYPIESLQVTLRCVLETMLSKNLCIEVNANNESNLLISEIIEEDGEVVDKNPIMPIRLNDLDAILCGDMERLNCKIGMTIGKSIKLYYLPKELGTTVCISNIKLDTSSTDGNKLFSILTADAFNYEALDSFFCKRYKEIDSNKLISLILHPYIYNPDIKFKFLLRSILREKGIEEEFINDYLQKIKISVTYKGEHQTETKESIEDISTISHDTTKFSIDGTNFLSKRNFVLFVVKKYVEDHPYITYDELNNVFRSDIISKIRGIVRPLETVKQWIGTKPDLKKRYCLKEEEIITLSNGQKVVVNNQWGTGTFPKFLHLIENFYQIQSDREYSEYPLSSNVSMVSDNKDAPQKYSKGINISTNSLQDFKKGYKK